MTAPIRLLVCGGRGYRDRDYVFGILASIELDRGPIEVLMHGDAPGADSIAHEWACGANIPIDKYPADWSRGLKAGPERNQRMIDVGNPTLVVAFRGGRGTEDMKRRARRAGIEVIEP